MIYGKMEPFMRILFSPRAVLIKKRKYKLFLRPLRPLPIDWQFKSRPKQCCKWCKNCLLARKKKMILLRYWYCTSEHALSKGKSMQRMCNVHCVQRILLINELQVVNKHLWSSSKFSASEQFFLL
jgi:hypothetical protein